MKKTGLIILLCCTIFAASATSNSATKGGILRVLQFKGSATYKYFTDKNVHFAQYEYCGVGFCQAIKGVATDKTTQPLLAVAYLWLAYIDDDASVTNWFHISPMQFAVNNVADRTKVLQQWRPKHCDSPKRAETVVCTLQHLVTEHKLKLYFVRYDEGLRNTGEIPWSKHLNVAQFIIHENKLAKHLGK
ncbi:MAG: hypothetical protein HRT35_03930 [Algicola sp.]|nr:hypothetical protein [Algicola sp.]